MTKEYLRLVSGIVIVIQDFVHVYIHNVSVWIKDKKHSIDSILFTALENENSAHNNKFVFVVHFFWLRGYSASVIRNHKLRYTLWCYLFNAIFPSNFFLWKPQATDNRGWTLNTTLRFSMVHFVFAFFIVTNNGQISTRIRNPSIHKSNETLAMDSEFGATFYFFAIIQYMYNYNIDTGRDALNLWIQMLLSNGLLINTNVDVHQLQI